VSTFNLVMTNTSGIIVSRKKPGHFIALTADGRIDASLAGGRLADALEKRKPINVTGVQQGPNDGSSLVAAITVRTVDPYAITVVMPAADGEPVVSEAEAEAWSRMRVAYDVMFAATPFTISGLLLMLASQDPASLAEASGDLFFPVFAPTIALGDKIIPDTPRDSVLVNRSHVRRIISARPR
jgi:hypothetical protein